MTFISGLKYVGAFVVGFLTPLVGTMATGHWPSGSIWPIAIATGLTNTGFFHMKSPAQKDK